MSQEQDVFDDESGNLSFESFCKENGFRSWSARWLMERLGYADFSSFQKAINKAQQVCLTLNIELDDNFKKDSGHPDGIDYRLSRFACYLAVMHADPRKANVAKAQAFFAAGVEAFRQTIQEAESVERVTVREDISDHEKSLNSAAKALSGNYRSRIGAFGLMV